LTVFREISLREYNTFGIDYKADCLISVKSEEEAISLLRDHKMIINPLFILGGGSNLLFTDNFNGTLLHSAIEGISIEEEHPGYVIVSAGSGITWDNFVNWSVNNGFGGIENLSLIPGMVGATPVQNIGAYGVEVKDSIEKVRAVTIENGTITEFDRNACRFGYRNSIFKSDIKGKYLITKVYYRLSTSHVPKIDYGSLNEEVQKFGDPTLRNVREAVISIRRNKLPDPGMIANAGSFFKNPVVSRSAAVYLKESYPQMPLYEDISGGKKIAAGWLIEHAGWKGKRIGNAGVHEKQALVIVNFGNAAGKEIYNLSEAIKKSVHEKFGIELEREVEVIGTI
jgi:UDP-N-acetylmuramate dehydrogenase